MTEVITRTTIEHRLATLNRNLEKEGLPTYALDYNRYYGYKLEYEGTRNHVTNRMNNREMDAYINGMLTGVWAMMQRATT